LTRTSQIYAYFEGPWIKLNNRVRRLFVNLTPGDRSLVYTLVPGDSLVYGHVLEKMRLLSERLAAVLTAKRLLSCVCS